MSNSTRSGRASYPGRADTAPRAAPAQLDLLLPAPDALATPRAADDGVSGPSPRDAALARLLALWLLAKPHLGRRAMDCPTLWFVRGKLYAGRAHYPDQRIEINEDLLERHPEPMLRETVAHELAHLLTQRIHGRRAQAHGREWQAVMREWFNVEPERTHHFDMSGFDVRRQQRFRYRCVCREHDLSAVRHNRARRGVEYRCVHCAGPLQHSPDTAPA